MCAILMIVFYIHIDVSYRGYDDDDDPRMGAVEVGTALVMIVPMTKIGMLKIAYSNDLYVQLYL